MRIAKCLAFLSLLLVVSAATYGAKGQMVSYKAGDETVNAYLALPDSGMNHPGIVMTHEIWGLNDWIKGQANRLADMGYVVVAVDLFHGQTYPETSHGGHDQLESMTQPYIMGILKAGYSYLESRPEVNRNKIGAMGWCMGGRLSLQLAMSEPSAKVAIVNYGQLPISATEPMDSKKRDWTTATPEGIDSVHFPVMVNSGAADADIKPAEVMNFEKVLKAHGKTVDAKLYPGFGHGFENDSSKDYNAEAAKDAFARIDAFLAKNLK